MARKSSNTRNLRRFNKELATRLQETANRIAKVASTAITARAQASFDSGQTVYGGARPDGKYGPLSLRKSGDARGSLVFTADGGSKIRAVLAHPYVRFLIGKYGILPNGNAALPFAWLLDLKLISNRELAKETKAVISEAA